MSRYPGRTPWRMCVAGRHGPPLDGGHRTLQPCMFRHAFTEGPAKPAVDRRAGLGCLSLPLACMLKKKEGGSSLARFTMIVSCHRAVGQGFRMTVDMLFRALSLRMCH